MTSPLDNLASKSDSLRREAPDAAEYAGLIRSATVRLIDAEKADNSLESRFDLAYNAAHALCLAALRHAGYRARNRYIVFQVLPHTLGLGPEVWRVLAKCHQIRNQGEYEGDLNVDDRLVEDLIVACKAVAKAVTQLSPLE
jgi:hypothetical protein